MSIIRNHRGLVAGSVVAGAAGGADLVALTTDRLGEYYTFLNISARSTRPASRPRR